MTPWTLVSPASRGIGHDLVKRLLRTSKSPIVVTARTDIDGLRKQFLSSSEHDVKDRLHVLQLDVTEEDSIKKAAAYCKETFPSTKDNPAHLHAAFVIPGILHPEKSPSQLDMANIRATFHVNTIGPMMMLKHFSPFLPKKSTQMPSKQEIGESLPASHATWLSISARVGSISDNQKGGWYSYRASKAAVNQVMKTFDAYLKIAAGDKAMAMAYHPGTVKTDLSKDFWEGVEDGKLFSPDYATEKLLEVVASHEGRVSDVRGKCWDWKGTEIQP